MKDWLTLVPPMAALAGLGYTFYLAYCPLARPEDSKCSAMCNRRVRKNEAKVVDILQIEDIAEQAAFCRCWKSKNVNTFIN